MDIVDVVGRKDMAAHLVLEEHEFLSAWDALCARDAGRTGADGAGVDRDDAALLAPEGSFWARRRVIMGLDWNPLARPKTGSEAE